MTLVTLSKMLRFLTGDELGNVKSLRYSLAGAIGGSQVELKTIHAGTLSNGKPNAVQALAAVSGSILLRSRH